MSVRSLSKFLRELGRYSLRAARILRIQGPRMLFRVVKQRFTGRQPAFDRTPRLLDLSEPLDSLRFAECPLPTASVIIPIHGDFRSTHHCLAALRICGSVHPFEVIVVDGGPKDGKEKQRPRWEHVRIIATGEPLGFGESCNLGAEVARGAYLIFLDDRTQVQAGCLDALVDTFGLKGDAGIVGGRHLYLDGRQQEAGGIVMKDGTICRYGHLDDPQRPEYSYLREVDFCAATLLAVRRELFRDLQGFDGDFAASRYTDVDLAFRVRQADFSVYYQPLSEVVHFAGEGIGGERNGRDTNRSEALSREHFVRRWKRQLQEHASGTDALAAQKERSVSKRAFVSDFAIPMPDRDSGSLRMVHLLTILQEQGFATTFASIGLDDRQPYLSDLQKRGIECLYRPYETSSAEHLRRHGACYDLVILSRVDTAAELMGTARRWCPNAKIVFDTVDLHFQRIAREADLRKAPRIARIAERKKKQELALIAQAHTTLVVSEAEKALLAAEAPSADVQIVSNIHCIYGSAQPFRQRRDILFVGGFAHPPNEDAVSFFCKEVFPRVLETLPEVRFFVLGSDPPEEVAALGTERVHILGYVSDIEPYLKGCRLSVAPLRFGAGVKGKINQSLAYGLPVVATTVAAEGMFLEDGASVLIADKALEFADAVVKLYLDEALWNQVSVGGLAVMEDHFSFAAARRALAGLLAS